VKLHGEVNFSQKHDYKYRAKLWYLLLLKNYMFRHAAAIIRFWQLPCYNSYI